MYYTEYRYPRICIWVILYSVSETWWLLCPQKSSSATTIIFQHLWSIFKKTCTVSFHKITVFPYFTFLNSVQNTGSCNYQLRRKQDLWGIFWNNTQLKLFFLRIYILETAIVYSNLNHSICFKFSKFKRTVSREKLTNRDCSWEG